MAFNFRVKYKFDPETGYVEAYIPELNHISSFGRTFEEAEEKIKEAALAYLEALAKEKKKIPQYEQEQEGTFIRLNFRPV